MADDGAAADGATDGTADGVEQFQRAALDAVKAARAMLDAAESVIKDPAALDSVVRTMTSFARQAGATVAGFAADAGAAARGPSPTDPGDGPRDDDDGGYERIRVD